MPSRDDILKAFDEPVIINCDTSEKLIEEQADELRTFLLEMGTQTQQGAVGLVIDRDYLEIAFPLEGQTNGEEREYDCEETRRDGESRSP